MIDQDPNNAFSVENADTLAIPAGNHHFQLSHPFMNVREFQLSIQPDSTYPITVSFIKSRTLSQLSNNYANAKFFNANGIIFTDPSTNIILNGDQVGTEYYFVQNTDIHEYTLQNKNFEKRTNSFSHQSFFDVEEYFLRPEKKEAMSRAWLPGFSQFYKGQTLKGLAFSTSFLMLTASVLPFNNPVVRNSHDYSKKNELSLKGALAAVYIINLIDAFQSTPKGGYREPAKSVDFYFGVNPTTDTEVLGFRLHLP